MLTVQEARDRVLAALDPLPPVEVRLVDAGGLVLAKDLHAPHDLPRFDNSAMDGYAVRHIDVAGASADMRVALALTGEVKAGEVSDVILASGTCVRIMTGAQVPRGADAVVPVEDTEEVGAKVWVAAEPPAHGHIRPAGDDVSRGAAVVSGGMELGPGELALLASLGLSPVLVHGVPTVAIVSTGDELVSPEEEPGPGRIRDSNTVALTALVENSGGRTIIFREVADDLDSVVATLERAAGSADLVVSGGGVSVGRYDFVKQAVERLGGIDLWRVAMQPGKPVVSGVVCGTPFLGLPGNPVSVHVGFEQFVRPAIRKLRGCRSLLRAVMQATLTEGLAKKAGRLHFVRVSLVVDGATLRATPIGRQGSHIQSSLIGCHGVARFPAEETELPAGAEVEVEVWALPEADASARTGGRDA